MIYTVQYIKTNNFMKFGNDDPMLKRETDEGDVLTERKFQGNAVPGSTKDYVPQFKMTRNRYLVDMTQDELNQLIQDGLDLFDEDGNKIERANLRNINDPFFKHSDLHIVFESGQATFDDEIPLHKFWLACFRADPNFMFAGEEVNPAMSAKVKYRVTSTATEEAINEKVESEAIRAVDIFYKMNHDEKVKVLKAMGVYIEDADPEKVRKLLYRKISDDKDAINRKTRERNIDSFLRFAEMDPDKLNLQSLISDARKEGLIVKGTGNKYYYQDVAMGRTLDDVYVYLNDEDNNDMLNVIASKLKE